MLTEYETRKLQDQMKRELYSSPAVVPKCALMLAVIFGLAWIGQKGEAEDDAASQLAENFVKRERLSRIVFQQRRQRYVEAHPETNTLQGVDGMIKPVKLEENYSYSPQ